MHRDPEIQELDGKAEDGAPLVNPQASASGYAAGYSQQSSGQYNHPQSNGQYSHPQFSHPQSSGQYSHSQPSGQYSHPQSSGQYSHPQSSGQFSHPQPSGQYSHPQPGMAFRPEAELQPLKHYDASEPAPLSHLGQPQGWFATVPDFSFAPQQAQGAGGLVAAQPHLQAGSAQATFFTQETAGGHLGSGMTFTAGPAATSTLPPAFPANTFPPTQTTPLFGSTIPSMGPGLPQQAASNFGLPMNPSCTSYSADFPKSFLPSSTLPSFSSPSPSSHLPPSAGPPTASPAMMFIGTANVSQGSSRTLTSQLTEEDQIVLDLLT